MRLLTFKGGIHPKENKHATELKAIRTLPVSSRLVVPLRQHIGAPCEAKVAVGDLVKKGQIIGDSTAFVSSPVHAPTSGKVVEIKSMPHPVFGVCPAVVIEADGADEWAEGVLVERDWTVLTSDELKKIIRNAGIVGMGGATFPAHVKLSPPEGKKIDVVILNGAECEPYLTSDHRLMLERAQDIVTGLKIIMKILGVERGVIAIENNKPDAIEELSKCVKGEPGIEVVALLTKYPQGAEKTLIKVVTGKEVPSGGLPMDVGVVVQNVGTAVAVTEAVTTGKPLLERVVTVAGSSVAEPQNVLVRIGTPFADVIEACGGFVTSPAKVIMGGPMMGLAQASLDVPVIKGTSGILALSEKDLKHDQQKACIRCGACVRACPMRLVPSMLGILGEKGRYAEARDNYSLLDCVECGSCVYVCPAKRHIVQYVKLAKMQLAKEKR